VTQTSHNQTITATLELLAERWPKCFSIWEKRRKPLKIGIHVDLAAALDGAVTAKELGGALRVYTANKVYRSRLVAGATRVGLDGAPAGIVTESEATPKSKTATPTKTTPAISVPKRLGLAELKAAAAQRKAAAA
jgi:ProP effector